MTVPARRRTHVIALVLACWATACVAPAADGESRTTPTPTATDEVDVDAPAAPGAATVTSAAAMPEPRTEVSGAVLGGRVVVLGGLTAAGSASDRVDAYDPETDAWQALPDLPEPLHHAAVVQHRGRLWVLGGYASEGDAWVPRAQTYSLGADGGDWSPGPPLPAPRGALAATSDGDALWAVAGVGRDGLSAETYVLRDDAVGWERGPDLHTAREHLAAVAVDDRVYVIAGRTGGLATNLDDVEVIDRDHTEPVSGGRLGTARGGIAGAAIGASPCVAGGETPSGTIATVECLGPDGWEVVARLTVPRHGLAVVALDGALHVIGGGPDPGLTVSDAHEIVRFDG